jgi:riboflavin-specific deaminase-like protein
VTVNMAITADGKIASENRRVCSFGSAEDHALLYELRSRADAVMCGANTVNVQNVDLNSGGASHRRRRVARGLEAENARIVVTGSARLRPRARIFSEPGGPIVVLTTERAAPEAVSALERRGAVVLRCGLAEVDLPRALRWLRRDHGIRRLHCEGGGTLNASLFAAGLVDELFLTVCPLVLGGRGSPTIADGAGGATLGEAFAMRLTSLRRRGDELFLHFRRNAARKKAG